MWRSALLRHQATLIGEHDRTWSISSQLWNAEMWWNADNQFLIISHCSCRLKGIQGLSRYRLMQRAIGDMSLLQKIDADVGRHRKKKWCTQSHQNSLLFDAVCHLTGTLGNLHSEARGYWKLFSKGIITSKFWNSAKRLALVHSAYNTLQSIITNSCHPMVHSNFNTHMAKLCRMCSQWL